MKKSIVKIFTSQGAEVMSIPFDKLQQSDYKIDINHLADGGYFVSIEDENQKTIGSFIKLK